MSFTNSSGGLVDTIVAGAANNVTTGFANQLSSNIQFSVGSVLSGAVTDASGFLLNQGNNYLLSQISSAIPPSTTNSLGNAVVTQIASVGINAAQSFASSTISSFLGSGFGGGGESGLPFGLGAAGGGASGGGAGGFIGLHAEGLPEAEYGGQRFTTTDIVFSIVPANAGPQTQEQPQTTPTVDTSKNFSSKLPGAQNNTLAAFKKDLALGGPATGINANPGKGTGSISNIKSPTRNFISPSK